MAYGVAWDQTPSVHRDRPLTMEATNHRERAQATNLALALDEIGPDRSLMVWCGNGHSSKERAEELVPMGVQFAQVSGIDPFSIDQLATVSLADGSRPRSEMTYEWKAKREQRGGTAAFTNNHHRRASRFPRGMTRWCSRRTTGWSVKLRLPAHQSDEVTEVGGARHVRRSACNHVRESAVQHADRRLCRGFSSGRAPWRVHRREPISLRP